MNIAYYITLSSNSEVDQSSLCLQFLILIGKSDNIIQLVTSTVAHYITLSCNSKVD